MTNYQNKSKSFSRNEYQLAKDYRVNFLVRIVQEHKTEQMYKEDQKIDIASFCVERKFPQLK